MEGRIMGKEITAAPALQHRDGGQETKTARGRRSRSYDYSTQNVREGQSVRREYYQAVKERVPVPEAARNYGFTMNRAGFISCPFHAERTPSLKLRPAGWKCYGCGEGGSVIDFVGKLFGLSLSDAVRKLNDDFSLGLPLTAPMTEQEQRQAKEEADRRQFVSETMREYEAWRDRIIRRLKVCLWIADDAAESDPDELTDDELLALRNAPALEFWWQTLAFGSLAQQMEVFDDRKGVDGLCGRILTLSLTRFTTA